MPENPTYVCRKCGEELYLDELGKWAELACPECDEPIPQEELMRAFKSVATREGK